MTISLHLFLFVNTSLPSSSFSISWQIFILSLFIFIQQHTLSLSLPIYSLTVCQLLSFVSATAANSSKPLLQPRLHCGRCCSVSAYPLLLRLSVVAAAPSWSPGLLLHFGLCLLLVFILFQEILSNYLTKYLNNFK